MHASKKISYWLFTCAFAVFLMALVGAITRLTESGLSIVEWSPVMGAVPPLSDADWAEAFSAYQETPQYKIVNEGMSLAAFKQIYFWEWFHRLLGRMIGVIYFVPLVYFWIRKKIPDGAKKPLAGIMLLGFMQGALGWFMVASGLVDQPAVSHYRLAAHLGMALLIFCCLLYMGLALRLPRDADAARVPSLRGLIKGTMALAAVTIFWGALVAGLRAGLLYGDSFPLMGKHLWPSEIFAYTPWWKNFFENHATVQFIHRVLALLFLVKVVVIAKKGLTIPYSRRVTVLLTGLVIAVCIQMGLGVVTLITQVNIIAATLHQAGAMTILALLTALLYTIPPVEKMKG